MENVIVFLVKCIIDVVVLIVLTAVTLITSLFITELMIDFKNRTGKNVPDRTIHD